MYKLVDFSHHCIYFGHFVGVSYVSPTSLFICVFPPVRLTQNEINMEQDGMEIQRSDNSETSPHSQPIQANGQSAPPSSADGGRDARIAIRKARIEAARIANLKPSDKPDGILHDNQATNTRRKQKVAEPLENRESGRAKTQIELSRKQIHTSTVDFMVSIRKMATKS